MNPQANTLEVSRLAALQQLGLLDTPPEERFDAIVARAATWFDAPMAAFSLVDSSRSWFKAKVGLGVEEILRDVSFCGRVVEIEAPLVIENTATYREFATSPLVIGEPYIAFYAGMPVKTASGQVIGTLCILDTSPREFPWRDFQELQVIAEELQAVVQAA